MNKLPSKDDIKTWIIDNPEKGSKREIARAFGIKGAARIELKRLLKELAQEGVLEKRKKTYSDPSKLPPVAVLQITGPDEDGDLFARPMEWQGDGPEPKILLSLKSTDPALGQGDRILARLSPKTEHDHQYVGRLIRRIGNNPTRILGIFRDNKAGGRITPIERGADKEWQVPEGMTLGAKDNELVEAEQTGPKNRLGLPSARVVERLGDPSAARAVSLIAIHQHQIPFEFPDSAIAQADAAKPAPLEGRTDLRKMPFVTIDPSDARDHDDAVAAFPDPDPKNVGGHIVWVAIADVAYFVTSTSALDKEAIKRGNSSYFPDRVVPMLPDRLSGDLCSLHEGVDRPCIAVEMVLDSKGDILRHRFERGLLKSMASLNYVEVQEAKDGSINSKVAPFMDNVVEPLYAAYECAKKARENRQPLDLDLPERRIELDDAGKVTSVAFRDRLDAHRLIEEFMILANVCAAETLISKQTALLFRVHEEPGPEKLDSLREVAKSSGFPLAKGQVLKTVHLNKLLKSAEGTDFQELINLSTLRSMTQAYYARENFGHFGLALKNYAHFTSPIRRYADLIVHRALISAHGWGKDGLSEADINNLDEVAVQISSTERRSMAAERDTNDRYLASFLSEQVGADLTGKVAGIAKFGVFVKLDETGADGLVPMRGLGREYFHFNRDTMTLRGSDSGLTIGMGQPVTVRLAEAVPVTGGLILELVSIDGAVLSRGDARSSRGRSKSPKKKVSRRRKR